MRISLRILAVALLNHIMFVSCNFTSGGNFTELSRIYSPDSSKFILKYNYVQGGWDGGRTFAATVLNSIDTVEESMINYSYSSLTFDEIYWNGNDSIIIEENFTEFISQGKSKLKDTILIGVDLTIIQKDPIDTSFTRKIFYQETSPNGKNELIVYKYVKPVNGNYFLNISVINKGDSIPKFGNFYVSRYDFDCFTDIRWSNRNILDIKVSEACYYSFTNYLVKERPGIQYEVEIDDRVKGNIRPYMR